MLGALCRILGAESLCHLDDCSCVCVSYLYYHHLSGTADASAFNLSLIPVSTFTLKNINVKTLVRHYKFTVELPLVGLV